MQQRSDFDKEVDRVVARRLDELTEHPERLMNYDANRDGLLDSEEWERVRSLVRQQVLIEFGVLDPERSPDAASQDDSSASLRREPSGGDWGGSGGASDGASPPAEMSETRLKKPSESRITVDRTPERLFVSIPAAFSRRRFFDGLALPLLGGVVLLSTELPTFVMPFLLLAVVGWSGWNLFFANSSFDFEATGDSWSVTERHWGIPFKTSGSAFKGARIEVRTRQSRYSTTFYDVLQVSADGQWHDIDVTTSKPEMEWVVSEMKAFASDSLRQRLALESEHSSVA